MQGRAYDGRSMDGPITMSPALPSAMWGQEGHIFKGSKKGRGRKMSLSARLQCLFAGPIEGGVSEVCGVGSQGLKNNSLRRFVIGAGHQLPQIFFRP